MAEKAERIQDMMKFTMELIPKLTHPISKDEWNIIANAFKSGAANLWAEIKAIIFIQQSSYFG